MMRIIQKQDEYKTCEAICPFCFSDIIFYVSAPVYCPKCSEELPPLTEFMEYLEYRIDHHFHGKDQGIATC